MARIYQTPSMGEAHIRVAITNQGDADLLVYRASSWGSAQGDEKWFITRNKQDAQCMVFFTSLGMAQVKICFVNTMGEAGWQTDSKFRGRFGN